MGIIVPRQHGDGKGGGQTPFRHVHDEFIVAHYNKDTSAKEIAKILNIPRGTVISRYHYAMGNRIKNKYYRQK